MRAPATARRTRAGGRGAAGGRAARVRAADRAGGGEFHVWVRGSAVAGAWIGAGAM